MKKNKKIEVRVTEDEYKMISFFTELSGAKSMSQYVLENALGHPTDNFTSLLEERDGVWYFKDRKLEVFKNYYLWTHPQEQSIEEWADLYSFPVTAMKQAEYVCTVLCKVDYDKWIKENTSSSAKGKRSRISDI